MQNGLHQSDKLVPIKNLLTPDFLSKFTNFSTLSEFAEHSDIDWENIDFQKLNNFVAQNTSFDTWSELIASAGKIWFSNQMKSQD